MVIELSPSRAEAPNQNNKRAGDDVMMPVLSPLPSDPRALLPFLSPQLRYDSKKPLRRRRVIEPDPSW